jgi:hypothetical protein
LVDANVSEKNTVSIFRAKVMMLRIKGWQEGNSERKGQSEKSEVRFSQANEETPRRHKTMEGRRWVGEMKSALFWAHGTGLIPR